MGQAFICDALRTPIGRYGGSLAAVRADDLAAHVIRELVRRHAGVDWSALDDVILGCANQAGEDNRNVARMSLLLAGLPQEVPGVTVNRLCGSGLEALGAAARAISCGEAELILAGGVESMSRAPFVMGKAVAAFDRGATLYDTTMGWRFINPAFEHLFGVDSMMQTAENLAREVGIRREEQDVFALESQEKALKSQQNGDFASELIPGEVPKGRKETIVFEKDEHPRQTSLEKMAGLKALLPGGTVTAGNASGINDGAAALLVASDAAIAKYSLTPLARIVGMTSAGVEPRIMGMGPVPATQKLLQRLHLNLDDLDLIELNEAFAAQALACIKKLGLSPADPRINPRGGAIALGHPLGMSGARLAVTASRQLQQSGGKRALCTMCIGVGQGIAMVIERV